MRSFTELTSSSVVNRSLCVALRSQPIDAAGSVQPIIRVGLARKPFDVTNFGTWTVSVYLPIALCDALQLENHSDSGRFAHEQSVYPFDFG
jgi:hypothetical protein